MFEAILDAIREYDTIIIHRHSKPDGDAMGSQIGLKDIIQTNFPEMQVFAVGDEARFYGFMDDSKMDEIPDSLYENALAVILDCGAAGLISDQRYTLAAKTVRMDHHLFVQTIADVEFIDSSYESCCGIVAHFAKESGLKLDPIAAKSLYTGLISDSGRFRYDSPSADTFRPAAFLMQQAGFHCGGAIMQLWKEVSSGAIQDAQAVADRLGMEFHILNHNIQLYSFFLLLQSVL